MIHLVFCLRSGIVAACVLLAAGCASRPPAVPAASEQPRVLVPARLAGVADHRAAFRQLFCTIHQRLAGADAAQRPCAEVLLRFAAEPDPAASFPIPLDRPPRSRVAIVRGLGWECSERFIDSALLPARHLERRGYQVTEIAVGGLSGSARNAAQIRDSVLAVAEPASGRKLLLIGHSKGAADILQAVATYPEVAERVAAVISVAGGIGGSPLAYEIPADAVALVTMVPGTRCEQGDAQALESLKPHVRQQWLAAHPLPGGVRYYSVVAAPEPDRVSVAMRAGQRKLSVIDPRNDGALLPQDQIIPGGVLLGYVNADHWAVVLPIAASNRLLGSTVVNRNDFPRDALWEAMVRYVEWDLEQRGP
jgi:pimeloyl-ACP methyl ester carboxylesterase